MIKKDGPSAFYKYWYLKLNDPVSQRALWIRFTLLSSGNGFKRIAETWAIYFQRISPREVKKTAVKQTHDISEFRQPNPSEILIGDCKLSHLNTRGAVLSKGQSIEWDLTMRHERDYSFNFIPEILSQAGLIKNSIHTDSEELFFSGTTQINGETLQWKNASGMTGSFNGPKNSHSWVWGHCNTFWDDRGNVSEFLFDGLSARNQIGPIVAPRLSSFFFRYQGTNYFFNQLRDALHIKSKNTLNSWQFQADRDDLSFRGHAKAEHKDFAGLTYDDTNGSLLYCANSSLSDLIVLVYRSGKLESTFTAQGTAALEIVSRKKNPYVPLMI